MARNVRDGRVTIDDISNLDNLPQSKEGLERMSLVAVFSSHFIPHRFSEAYIIDKLIKQATQQGAKYVLDITCLEVKKEDNYSADGIVACGFAYK